MKFDPKIFKVKFVPKIFKMKFNPKIFQSEVGFYFFFKVKCLVVTLLGHRSPHRRAEEGCERSQYSHRGRTTQGQASHMTVPPHFTLSPIAENMLQN